MSAVKFSLYICSHKSVTCTYPMKPDPQYMCYQQKRSPIHIHHKCVEKDCSLLLEVPQHVMLIVLEVKYFSL